MNRVYMIRPTLVYTAFFNIGASQIKNASSDCLGKDVGDFDLRTRNTP